MGALSPVQYQYRSFESTYLFKVKDSDQISLRILDLAQNCIFKRVFSSQELSHLDVQYLLKTGDFNQIIESLVDRHLLSKEYSIPMNNVVTRETCEEVLEQIIKQFKSQILVEKKELEKFTCPITLEIFREPVMDKEGHTFEKSAIEEHLKRSNECPIGREPIGDSLIPNRIVQQAIEECQQQDPIPSFSLFQKENPKLANMHLQTAKTCVEEEEYNEALEAYTKAFQYTKNWVDYSAIPTLFERMGEDDKATLAYLYLAKYQLQAGNIDEAIQTLEACLKGQSALPQIKLVLIELYYYTKRSKIGFALAAETAARLAKEHPGQAIIIYKRMLKERPTEFSIYSILADFSQHSQEKTHILLKGALEALQANEYSAVELLTQKAERTYSGSFIDGLVSLELVKQQGTTSQVKQKLFQMAQAFEAKGLTSQMLSAYKMLFQLDNDPVYSQKIITAYQTLQKPQKEVAWSLTHLSLLVEHQQWEQAEGLAKQLLQQLPELQQQLVIYERLEEVYTNWHGHEIRDLWKKLGRAYRDNQQLDTAEGTYRKAFERFHGFEEAIVLAEVLHETGKTQDSVHTYYEAAVEALLEQNTTKLSLSTKGIKQIDPCMQYLDINQKMLLLTQGNILKLTQENLILRKHISKLSDELQTARQVTQTKITSLEQIVQPLKGKVIQDELSRLADEQERVKQLAQEHILTLNQENLLLRGHVSGLSYELQTAQAKIASLEQIVQPLREKAIQEEQERIRLAEIERARLEELSKPWFGKAKWGKYFGDIGIEPPLPANIFEILSRPCPYWNGKQIKDTHILILIPQTVNGRPLSLNTLRKLIQYPQGKGHATKYSLYYDVARREIGDQSVPASYWALITKDVLPNSRNKTYSEQPALIKRPYTVPRAIEIATGILMHYVETGERLYSDNPDTFTTCQEILNTGFHVLVGSFGSSGLAIYNYHDHCRDDCGCGVVRRF